MALFKLPEDLRLPMVTQIVQLEKEDLQAFLSRDHYVGIDPKRKVCGPLALYPDIETQLAVLSVRDLARDILRERAKIGKTHKDLIARLGAAYQDHSPIYTVLPLSVDDEGYVQCASREAINNSLSDGLLMILDDLLTVIQTDMRVLICEECDNPAVQTHGGRSRYCSTRCGNRARSRKFQRQRRDKAA